MALHTTLPIYKASYDLLGIAIDYVKGMPRDVKPLIGQRISGLCAELVELIYKANCVLDKLPFLQTLIERVEELNLWLRLCQDKRFISRSQYAKAVELTTSVSKQAHGWRKHYAASPVV